MSIEDPFPAELIPDVGFGSMISHLCSHPEMYVGRADFSAVVAYIDGFNVARGNAPLLGFREWLVVKANTGNDLHWAGLVKLVVPLPDNESDEGFWIEPTGKLIAEYLAYRNANGITKVYYKYARWLLRKKWYRGPLRNRE
ncbi:MAG TPA: hypothetical protein PLX97_01070 [Gemmatales bacterium]|nr:hypothetical protein [Gemmatales bacterium]